MIEWERESNKYRNGGWFLKWCQVSHW